jgi:hypothetical protein
MNVALQIHSRGMGQTPSLIVSHGCKAITQAALTPAFDFNETKGVALPCDDIDFAILSPEAAGEDAQTCLAQVRTGRFLTLKAAFIASHGRE